MLNISISKFLGSNVDIQSLYGQGYSKEVPRTLRNPISQLRSGFIQRYLEDMVKYGYYRSFWIFRKSIWKCLEGVLDTIGSFLDENNGSGPEISRQEEKIGNFWKDGWITLGGAKPQCWQGYILEN